MRRGRHPGPVRRRWSWARTHSAEYFAVQLVPLSPDEQRTGSVGAACRAAPVRERLATYVLVIIVMSATIPAHARTHVYGDLDVSVLDEIRPEEVPVETTRGRKYANVFTAFIDKQVFGLLGETCVVSLSSETAWQNAETKR